MNEDARPWVDYATVDLRSADVLYAAGIWSQACFHVQQCVEKLLKATLIAEGKPYPRTHVIGDLFDLLDATDAQKLASFAMDISRMDRFYLPARYPGIEDSVAEVLPEQDDATEALATGRQVMDIAMDILRGQ